jgi:hypothetical protein
VADWAVLSTASYMGRVCSRATTQRVVAAALRATSDAGKDCAVELGLARVTGITAATNLARFADELINHHPRLLAVVGGRPGPGVEHSHRTERNPGAVILRCAGTPMRGWATSCPA